MGLKPSWPKLWAPLAVFLIGSSMLFGFQNCGKAGFDSEDGGTATLASLSTGDTAFENAPFPYDLQLNTISYMTCPAASKNGATDNATLRKAFYNIRAGGYDNSVYRSTFIPSETDPKKISNVLSGGLGLSADFLSFIQSKFGRKDAELVTRGLASYGTTVLAQPALAMIYEERTFDTSGFNYDNSLFVPMLGYLDSGDQIARLSKQASLAVPTERVSSFSALDPSRKGVVGSMAWGTSESNSIDLTREVGGSLILASAFSSGGIKNLLSPKGVSPVDKIYGRGYRFTMGANSATVGGKYFQSGRSVHLRGITELDLSQKPAKDLSSQEGANWSCFSLRIVRPADRLRQATGEPETNPGVFSYTHSSGTVIPGVRAACPNQFQGNLTGDTRLQLEMARRVLPADNWMINTDPDFMCAVPTPKGLGSGQCYLSGDENAGAYINYAAKTNNDCGGGSKNECPAYVSICYRSN